MDFTNSIVWITGASSGIGAAMAREAALRGARVAVSARREDRLRALVDGLSNPSRHLVVPLDVTSSGDAEAAAERVQSELGTPDVLIANAGIGQRDRVLDTDPEVERRIMEVNFFGVTNVARPVLRQMSARDSGRLVVISSVMGKLAVPGRATYAASKHALHGYFEGLRAELSGTDIGITMICPGYIRTEISEQALTADGSRHGEMDADHQNAMRPEAFAIRALDAIENRKAEVFIGGMEAKAPLLQRLSPDLVRFLMPRIKGT